MEAGPHPQVTTARGRTGPQSPVLAPQPGTYRNAAVARAAQKVAARSWSSSDSPSRPGESGPSTTPYRSSSSSSQSIWAYPRPVDTTRATGSRHHQEPAHQAPGKTVRPRERHHITYQHNSDTLTPPAHQHRAQPHRKPEQSGAPRQKGKHSTPDGDGGTIRYRRTARGTPRHHTPTTNGHPEPHKTPNPADSNVGPRTSSPDPDTGLPRTPRTL